jgi:hypothetical protein
MKRITIIIIPKIITLGIIKRMSKRSKMKEGEQQSTRIKVIIRIKPTATIKTNRGILMIFLNIIIT